MRTLDDDDDVTFILWWWPAQCRPRSPGVLLRASRARCVPGHVDGLDRSVWKCPMKCNMWGRWRNSSDGGGGGNMATVSILRVRKHPM